MPMEKTCFVIAPASAKSIPYIKNAAERHGLGLIDPNRIRRAGLVLSQIKDEMRRAAIVVADLTGNNPNVTTRRRSPTRRWSPSASY